MEDAILEWARRTGGRIEVGAAVAPILEPARDVVHRQGDRITV